MPGVRKYLAQGLPEAQCAVTNSQFGRGLKATFPQIREQLSPTGFGLPVAVLDSHQLLVTMLGHADDHQQAEPVIQTDVAVHAVSPPVHIALLAQVSALPVLVLIKPLCLEPGYRVSR